jgi:hypothetical protein
MCICTRRDRRNAVQVLEYKVLSIAPSRMYEFYIFTRRQYKCICLCTGVLRVQYYTILRLYCTSTWYIVLNSSPFRITRSRDFGLPSRDITVPNGIDSLQRCVYIQVNTNPSAVHDLCDKRRHDIVMTIVRYVYCEKSVCDFPWIVTSF